MRNVTDKATFKRGLQLKNRIIMAPMTTKMSFFDGVITKDELAYYGLRSGEVGAVITAAANVQEDGKGWEGELGAYDDAFLPGLSKLASTIKTNGTKAILQIFHAGRMTDDSVLRGTQPISASAVAAERPNAQVPREVTVDEILTIIENFKKATERAIKAGFDGVELHGANTYLIQQFFSPHSNRRADEWGGSLENRYRFIEKLVDEVLETVDQSGVKEFIVGYRFSPEEFEEPGIRFEDTLFLVDQLAEKGLDYLHISLADYTRKSISKAYQAKSMLAYVYEKIAQRVPLIGVGDVRTSKDAAGLLEHADFVAVGRALLIDPHWGQKVLDGQDELIRTTVSTYEREELVLQNGVWGFMENMMPDRLNEEK
ncbi:NADH-dependent flavin oxidoreductase [Enterococcus casseliflavus]|uniref:NADH-dependent flavin oxidoreductase n=1 Tax=Enterococcus casseliflavus TaxID=37734 RepID=UPI0037A3F177